MIEGRSAVKTESKGSAYKMQREFGKSFICNKHCKQIYEFKYNYVEEKELHYHGFIQGSHGNFKTKFPDFSMIIIHVFPEGFCCKVAGIVTSNGENNPRYTSKIGKKNNPFLEISSNSAHSTINTLKQIIKHYIEQNIHNYIAHRCKSNFPDFFLQFEIPRFFPEFFFYFQIP